MGKSASDSTALRLGSGVSPEDIRSAIAKSGYPLQTAVAASLRTQFSVLEEWSYMDRATQELRTIDIFAEKWLFQVKEVSSRGAVWPVLSLIVECKKAELPYVFFLSSTVPWVPYFPLLTGHLKNQLVVMTDDETSLYQLPTMHVLCLDHHSFLSSPRYCASFTKCERKGKGIELGGKAFHELVMPIANALHFFRSAQSSGKRATHSDGLVMGVGVVDAPMLGVRAMENPNELVPLSWVRLIRHATHELTDADYRTRLFAIDIVHREFLKKYVYEHVLPFANDFAKLAARHSEVLSSGRGFVSGMRRDNWNNLQGRLRPLGRRKWPKRTGNSLFRPVIPIGAPNYDVA